MKLRELMVVLDRGQWKAVRADGKRGFVRVLRFFDEAYDYVNRHNAELEEVERCRHSKE